METRRAACERTAQFVSLGLDGELSMFERVLLARHLEACPRCAAEAARVVDATNRLRAAPLEPLPAPVVVARPRRRIGRVVQSGIGVAAVAIIGIWFGLSSTGRSPAPQPALVPIPSTTQPANNGRNDWPAGLPRAPQMIQLVPGGLYTAGVGV